MILRQAQDERLFGPISCRILAGVAAVALASALVQTVRIEGFWFIGGLKDELAAREEQLRRVAAAQDIALEKAVAAKRATEAAYQAVARSADNETSEIERLRAAAGRYADSATISGSLQSEGACRPFGRAAAAGESDPSGNRDGPGVPAELLVVTRPDFDILIENSLRLERVRQWGEALVHEGLAVAAPEAEFGREAEH